MTSSKTSLGAKMWSGKKIGGVRSGGVGRRDRTRTDRKLWLIIRTDLAAARCNSGQWLKLASPLGKQFSTLRKHCSESQMPQICCASNLKCTLAFKCIIWPHKETWWMWPEYAKYAPQVVKQRIPDANRTNCQQLTPNAVCQLFLIQMGSWVPSSTPSILRGFINCPAASAKQAFCYSPGNKPLLTHHGSGTIYCLGQPANPYRRWSALRAT